MSNWLLIIVTMIYFGVAASYVLEKRYAMALVFFAYAVANTGLLFDGLERR